MGTDNRSVMPFLKWAGGKRWLVRRLQPLLKEGFRNYFEPFLGGGAVLLSIRPRSGAASDVNGELVNCYNQIKVAPKEIERRLFELQKSHSNEFYYHVRESEPSDKFERAVRFIYLNRACFNGIYRVNKSGKFNVPKGTKDTIFFESDDFERVANVLKNIEIIQSDFEAVIDRASEGDLVFVDPPYTTKHNNNGFVRYNEKMFTWSDQERLASAVKRASSRGARVIITNADHSCVRALYDEMSALYRPISRYSVIGGPKETRSSITEAIFLLGFDGSNLDEISVPKPSRREVITSHAAGRAS